VFEVHGRSAAGEVVLRRSLRRGQVEKLFAKLAPAVIGLEACGSAHHGRVRVDRVTGRFDCHRVLSFVRKDSGWIVRWLFVAFEGASPG
jgi:hypothetical protein